MNTAYKYIVLGVLQKLNDCLELYNSLPKDPEVKQLMEENKITHLIDVCPSSVEFVLSEAIKELGGIL